MIALAGSLGLGAALAVLAHGMVRVSAQAPRAEGFWTRRILAPRRAQAMRQILPDGLSLLAGSVRAGSSLAQGLGVLAGQAPEPLRGESRRILDEQASGRDLDLALAALGDRYRLPELDLALAGIRLSRKAGSDMAGLLDEASAL